MMERTYVGIALASAAILLSSAAPAGAAHVECGDTITQDTALDSDVVCASEDQVGLVIDGNDLNLRLAGYTIRTTGGGVGIRAVPREGEYSHLVVRRGTISGFFTAIQMTASDSSLERVSSDGGFELSGDRNYLHRNFLQGPGPEAFGTAMNLTGDDVYTWRNEIGGFGWGIRSSGDRPRHVLNTVSDCIVGLGAGGYTSGAVINRNNVTRCGDGISLSASDPPVGGGARVRLNTVQDNLSIGLQVSDATAVVGTNQAHLNNTGIGSLQPGTRIQKNAANNNDAYGINVAEGTIDGGGNTALGNGATPQCVNVACSAP